MFTSLNTGALGVSAPLDEALSLAHANGFEGLDLPVGELLQLAERTSLHEVRERFHAAGVRPEQVVYVHVNDAPPGRDVDEQIDNQRLLPGASGVIDIAGFLQALDRMGYDGPVVAEPFNAELNAMPPADRVRLTGQSLAKIWAQGGLHPPSA